MLARSSCTTLKLDEEAAFEPFVYNLAAAASAKRGGVAAFNDETGS